MPEDDRTDDRTDDRRTDDRADDRPTPPASTDRERELARESAGYRRRLREAESELERLRESSQTDRERELEQARREARAEADREWGSRMLAARVEARAAARRFHDPGDAARHLDLDDLGPDASSEDVDRALDRLLESKGYLAADENGAGAGDRGLGLVSPGARSDDAGRRETREDDANEWLRGARKGSQG